MKVFGIACVVTLIAFANASDEPEAISDESDTAKAAQPGAGGDFLSEALNKAMDDEAEKDRKAAEPPPRVYDEAVARELQECKDHTRGQPLAYAKCFADAAKKEPSNHTHTSLLTLAYLRGDMPTEAYRVLNESVKMLLSNYNHLFKDKNIKRFPEMLQAIYDSGEHYAKETAAELGMMLAKKLELEHNVGSAYQVYNEFLDLVPNIDSDSRRFHRNTGNIIAMITSKKAQESVRKHNSSILLHIASQLPSIVDGFTTHILGYYNHSDPVNPTRAQRPLKRFCGISVNTTGEVTAVEIVNHVGHCISLWGNLTKQLENETDIFEEHKAANGTADNSTEFGIRYINKKDETPLHKLAYYGLTGVMREALDYFDKSANVEDRFGRSLLYAAAAGGNEPAMRLLLSRGYDKNSEDKGKTKLHRIGCSHPRFRSNFEKITGDSCEYHERKRVEDEDIEPLESGNDGEWNPGFKTPNYMHSDVDVKNANNVRHEDLAINYLHSGLPVVLRNIFGSEGPNAKWRRSRFFKSFGNVLVRSEASPLGDRYGLRDVKIQSVREFMNSYEAEKKTKRGTFFGDVVVHDNNHPMYKLVDWHPDAFKPNGDVEDFFNLKKELAVLVIILRPDAQSHHHVRINPTNLYVVHGIVDVWLLPPRLSRSYNTNYPPGSNSQTGGLPADIVKFALRVSLYSGDALIVPEFWSISYRSRMFGALVEQPFLWKDHDDKKDDDD